MFHKAALQALWGVYFGSILRLLYSRIDRENTPFADHFLGISDFKAVAATKKNMEREKMGLEDEENRNAPEFLGEYGHQLSPHGI